MDRPFFRCAKKRYCGCVGALGPPARLPGGPSHLDLYDLKAHAPAEVRGEFQPIATQVPGIEVCEHLPRLAGIMVKLSPGRSGRVLEQVEQIRQGRQKQQHAAGDRPGDDL
jgi:hypothetical protein